MSNLQYKCCVCLNSNENLIQIGESNDKNEQWIFKLQTVVPEVEWSDRYKICGSCIVPLDVSFEFRNLCIGLDSSRKQALIPKIEARIIYTCFHCGSGFDNKRTLTKHIQGYHTGPATPVEKLVKTEKRAKRKNRFSCEVCNLVLGYAKSVIEHCVTEHLMEKKSIKPYQCDECSMRFSSSTNLIQHRKYHEGSRSLICSFCGKSYITKSDLTVHEYTHFNRRNYKCELCDKAFNTNKNLRSHNLVVHTDSSLWKFCCEVCTKRFPLKSGYDQHMRRHTGDKPFACHICSKPFVSRSELKKHMAYHSKMKPFKCPHCDKSYKERRIYEIHLKKSHGIGNAKVPDRVKKFACHVCPSTFFDKHKLERHLRSHSGVKPYECSECDKKFTDKYYLKQHLKNVHCVEDD